MMAVQKNGSKINFKQVSTMKKKTIIIIITVLILIASPFLYKYFLYPLSLYISPKHAVKVFLERDCAEDQIINPLIIAGKKVIPYIIEEIRNKEMDLRRYAIGALGHIGDEKVIPFLMSILNDDDEIYYFRYDAIEAIAMINIARAREVANIFIEKEIKMVTEYCKKLLESKDPSIIVRKKRTLLEAIIDTHY